MNETGPLTPNTSAAPVLPKIRSRREISNIALTPLVDPVRLSLAESAHVEFYTAAHGLFRRDAHWGTGMLPQGEGGRLCIENDLQEALVLAASRETCRNSRKLIGRHFRPADDVPDLMQV